MDLDLYNLILLGFIGALFLLAVWWAFNTVHRVEIQKNFCAQQLSSIAKLWRKAQFVPEDARERESFYLYRDFLRKFEDSDCIYPIMVKNGKVRAMSRKEFDKLGGLKGVRPYSPMMVLVSVVLAIASLGINLIVTGKPILGVLLALIMPVVQVVLAFFVKRFIKEQNTYRDGLFAALKANSTAFLGITKPYVVVDAYPEKFGKKSKPLYTVQGDITEEQVNEAVNFIVRQKEAESKFVAPTNHDAEIEAFFKPQNPNAVNTKPEQPVNAPKPAAQNTEAPAPAAAEQEITRPLSVDEKDALINDLINNTLEAEINRAEKKAAQAEQKPEAIEELAPLPTVTTTADSNAAEIQGPAEDDFSLDAIGLALDAEIAKRNKKK